MEACGSFVHYFVSFKAAGRQVCLSNMEVLLSTNLEYRSFMTELWLYVEVLLRAFEMLGLEQLKQTLRARSVEVLRRTEVTMMIYYVTR